MTIQPPATEGKSANPANPPNGIPEKAHAKTCSTSKVLCKPHVDPKNGAHRGKPDGALNARMLIVMKEVKAVHRPKDRHFLREDEIGAESTAHFCERWLAD